MSAWLDERRVLYAEFTARRGNEEQVAALVRSYSDRVRTEPGNLLFVPSRRRDRPDEFFVYEEYVDDAAFQSHISAEYGVSFNTALGALIVEDASQLTWLTTL